MQTLDDGQELGCQKRQGSESEVDILKQAKAQRRAVSSMSTGLSDMAELQDVCGKAF